MSGEANNVIKGPWSQEDVSPVVEIVDLTDTDDDTKMMMATHIAETLCVMIPMLFNRIELAGFSISAFTDDDENLKELSLIVESIRALLYKCYGFYHPLQDVVKELFIVREDGTLEFTKQLVVDLNDIEKIDLTGIEE